MYLGFTFINYFWFISYWSIDVNQNKNQNRWKLRIIVIKEGVGVTASRWQTPVLHWLDIPKPWVAQYPILIRCRWTHGFLSGGLQTVRVPSSLWTIYRTLTRLYRVRPLLLSLRDVLPEVKKLTNHVAISESHFETLTDFEQMVSVCS